MPPVLKYRNPTQVPLYDDATAREKLKSLYSLKDFRDILPVINVYTPLLIPNIKGSKSKKSPASARTLHEQVSNAEEPTKMEMVEPNSAANVPQVSAVTKMTAAVFAGLVAMWYGGN